MTVNATNGPAWFDADFEYNDALKRIAIFKIRNVV
jgi:hypothetical protein